MKTINLIIFLALVFLIAADNPVGIKTKITGDDEAYVADVYLEAGVKRLQVSMIGEAIITPGGISDFLIDSAEYSSSADMRVDGSTTPKTFEFVAGSQDFYLNELRLFGGCSGIKFSKHLCANTPLTTGIEIKIKSEDQVFTFPIIKATEDYKNKFSFFNGTKFRIDIQAGADQFLAIFSGGFPVILKKSGTYGTDDYVRIKIQDDLTGSAGGNLFEFTNLVIGFER